MEISESDGRIAVVLHNSLELLLPKARQERHFGWVELQVVDQQPGVGTAQQIFVVFAVGQRNSSTTWATIGVTKKFLF